MVHNACAEIITIGAAGAGVCSTGVRQASRSQTALTSYHLTSGIERSARAYGMKPGSSAVG